MSVPRHLRIYRTLLRLYPRAHRDDLGDEMALLFGERHRDERARRGRAGLARLWLRTLVDIGWNASLAHLAAIEGAKMMDALLQDLRTALRSLLRRPGFLVVATITLALGVGANAAIFGAVHRVLLEPLPYPEPQRLVFVWARTAQSPQISASYPEIEDWRAEARSLDRLAAWRGQSVNLTGDGEPDRLTGAFVTAAFLPLVGAELILGRAFADAETEPGTSAPVAVIAEGLWQRKFGGADDVVGRTVVLNGRPRTIIGVARTGDAEAPTLALFSSTDVWLPIADFPNAHGLERGQSEIFAIGRLAPGVAIKAAEDDVQRVARRLAAAYPDTQGGRTAYLQPLVEALVGPVRSPLLLLFAAVGIVLLVSCVNVANLLIARSTEREKELAVRAALGAGRWRLIRQLITESTVLAAIGSALGLAVAVGLLRALVLLAPEAIGLPSDTGIDGAVFGYTLAVSFATGILFGLWPAFRASRPDVTGILKGQGAAGARGQRFRDGLVVVEAALSLLLLVGASLLLRSAALRAGAEPGFRTDHVLAAQLRLPADRYAQPARIAAFFRDLVARLEVIPGVESAALVRATPFDGNEARAAYAVAGSAALPDGEQPIAQTNIVTPAYFQTLGIPLRAGRTFTAADSDGRQHVAVVNALLADRAFGGDALGKDIRVKSFEGPLTIVGVVADVKHRSLSEPPMPQVYVSHEQFPMIFTGLVVRTAGDPASFAPAVRAAVRGVDSDQPVWRFRTMDELVEADRRPARALGFLVGIFAAIAVALSGIGLYGVIATATALRTREIGIRLALGAPAGRVLRDIVARGLVLAAIAVILGLAGALALGRLLAGLLFGVAPTDPTALASAAAIVVAVSLLASVIPARRAALTDPARVLMRDG